MFANFKATFDRAPRERILVKLGEDGVSYELIWFIALILQENPITIQNSVTDLDLFRYLAGVIQNENLNLLLSSVFLNNLLGSIIAKRESLGAYVLLYACDFAIYRTRRLYIQQILGRL